MQYKLYCDMQEQEARLPVSQGRQLCCDKALGEQAGERGARADERGAQAGARGAQAGSRGAQAGARGTQTGRWARGARHRRWACCWAVGCALGALSLFLTRFDSVLFLSQFLDIVREPGS